VESIISLLLFVGFFYLMMKYGCGAHAHGGHRGHHRREPAEHTRAGNTADSKKLIQDPVCGMDIEADQAFQSVDYGTKTYYFCSEDCVRKFKERPENFAQIERMERRNIA
jgi:YHS domain-containing protein